MGNSQQMGTSEEIESFDISTKKLKKSKEKLKNEINNKNDKIKITIEWKEGGSNVRIAGDFINNWKDKIPMEKEGDIFRKEFVK